LIIDPKLEVIEMIGDRISKGLKAFLFQEYKIMVLFIIVFGTFIMIVVDILGHEIISFRCYASLAFAIGSVISILCGWIGMSVAVTSNYKATFKALDSIEAAFQVAFRTGCVMGFLSVGLGLGSLLLLLMFFTKYYKPESQQDYANLMELVTGYGLGGSAMALFGRVGGGIYTKATAIGADLVGKFETSLSEDSPRNPSQIASNVGDNVCNIAGIGSDLFGSFAESTCAALVLIASTPDIIENQNILRPEILLFPLMISSAGILACFISSFFGIYIYKVNTFERIQKALNLQLILSTSITLFFLLFTVLILPPSWTYTHRSQKFYASRWYTFIASALGCISGFLIGMSTDYYTSCAHPPVREMSLVCTSGPALNVIFGLSLGYMSNIFPVVLIALTILISINLLGMLGVALAALGMLSTLAISLAINVYSPICDNARVISKMSELENETQEIMIALDSSGNTTSAVGKGFSIGSAALVSLALFGAFITRAQNPKNIHPILSIDITDPWMFCSLLIGAMLPFWFSAMTMKSVNLTSKKMVEEVCRQFSDDRIREGDKEPDFKECIRVTTRASLKEMIAPGLLVLATPLLFGILMHPSLLAGLLPGALISGLQLAISMSNTGGAWSSSKKFIESGVYVNSKGEKKSKNSYEHRSAKIGCSIGQPLKDTSGPSINILIKLMAIISLVFARGFDHTSLFAKLFKIQQKDSI
jgi:inorganic pyrophosphatase